MQNLYDDVLLSPEKAALFLKQGASADEVFARLNVEECRFSPRVKRSDVTPCVETNFQGFGSPVSGQLVFFTDPYDDVIERTKRIHQSGERVIFVLEGHYIHLVVSDQLNPDGRICILPQTKDSEDDHNHFLIKASLSDCTLLDDPLRPTLALHEHERTLVLKDKTMLREGETVTIDPKTGQIWRGTLPILPPTAASAVLTDTFRAQAEAGCKLPVCGHVSSLLRDYSYFGKISNDVFTLESQIRTDFSFKYRGGLYRSDESLRECFYSRQKGKEIFSELLNGTVPVVLKKWEVAGLSAHWVDNYRLADIHGFKDCLPNTLVEELACGLDHQPGTEAFELRENLYRVQLRQALTSSNYTRTGLNIFTALPCVLDISVIIPSVSTTKEVRYFRNLVREEVEQSGCRGGVRFGVMMETKEALKAIGKIAPLSSSLCVGTNDLTASITGESRSNLQYNGWHVLVPEVIKPLAKAVATAHRVNPHVVINAVGHQTSGHDIPSIDAVLAMGVDKITVPMIYENLLRTHLAVLRFESRKKLGLPQLS